MATIINKIIYPSYKIITIEILKIRHLNKSIIFPHLINIFQINICFKIIIIHKMAAQIHLNQQIKSLLNTFSNAPQQKQQLNHYFVTVSHQFDGLPVEDNQIVDGKTKETRKDKKINKFNQELDCQLKKTFRKMMENQQLGLVGQLFDIFCRLAESKDANWAAKDIKLNVDKLNAKGSQKQQKAKPIIKKFVLINLLDDMLECVGITDLKNILDLIGEKINQFGKLEDFDVFKLLRIINTLLKRISKTEDFHIRGQLQITLTKILPLCHESGFRYRPYANKIDEQSKEEQLISIFKDEHTAISAQFYEQFWELQKYFLNPEEFTEDSHSSESRTTLTQAYICKLNHVKQILLKVLEYFRKNPINIWNDFTTFPLKFLKLPNLLQLQLQDGYFRGVVMIQVIIFVFSLKLPKKNPEIYASDKKIQTLVHEIEHLAKEALQKIDKSHFSKLESTQGILEKFSSFLQNQQYWIGLKDNWKDRKKGYFKESSYLIRETKRKLYRPYQAQLVAPQEEPSTIAPIDLKSRQKKAFDDSVKKLNINTSNLQKFLENPPKFHSQENDQGKLTKQPQIPSFSYFLNQTQECLESFDYDMKAQTQFSTRSQYNLFEWKAYRSLYRQNIKDTTISASMKNVNENLKQYRLLAMVHKKRDDFYSEPTKKVKMQRGEPQEEFEEKNVPEQIKQAIIQIRNKLTQQVHEKIQQKFIANDSNGDNILNQKEFFEFLNDFQIEVDQKLMAQIITVLDDGNKGEIEYDAIKKLILFDPFQ